MVQRNNVTPSLAIIDALDSLAAQVRKNHPDVPSNVVIALASGRSKKSAVHGHFAPQSWQGNHEILIGGESLARGARPVLGTLIHELAHAAAHNTEVRDTSNNGRYHNKAFKAIAESMGITLEQVPTHGWTLTSVPDETAAKYAAGIAKLDRALTTYRLGATEAKPVAPKARNKTKIKIDCMCEAEDNSVTVSKIWFERNDGIRCPECGEEFAEIPEN